MLLTAHELLLYVHIECRRHYATGQTTRAHAIYEKAAWRRWTRSRYRRFQNLFDRIRRVRLLDAWYCLTVWRFAYGFRSVFVMMLLNLLIIQICWTIWYITFFIELYCLYYSSKLLLIWRKYQHWKWYNISKMFFTRVT